MKKIALLLAIILMLTMAFVACTEDTTTTEGGGSTESRIFTVDELEIILAHLTANLVDFPQWHDAVTEDRFEGLVFIEYIPGTLGVSEMAFMAQPHAIVLLQLPDGVSASQVRQNILNNADPSMWICVEADVLEVVSYGRFVLMVMTDSDAADYQAILANAARYLSNGTLLESLVNNFTPPVADVCDDCGYEWCVCPCPDCGYDIFECQCGMDYTPCECANSDDENCTCEWGCWCHPCACDEADDDCSCLDCWCHHVHVPGCCEDDACDCDYCDFACGEGDCDCDVCNFDIGDLIPLAR